MLHLFSVWNMLIQTLSLSPVMPCVVSYICLCTSTNVPHFHLQPLFSCQGASGQTLKQGIGEILISGGHWEMSRAARSWPTTADGNCWHQNVMDGNKNKTPDWELDPLAMCPPTICKPPNNLNINFHRSSYIIHQQKAAVYLADLHFTVSSRRPVQITKKKNPRNDLCDAVPDGQTLQAV